jgi:hypothetical protein
VAFSFFTDGVGSLDIRPILGQNGPMSDKYSGEIDPEIAALLKTDSGTSAPKFEDLFEGSKTPAPSTDFQPEFSKASFNPIRDFTEAPKPVFENPSYYKMVLSDMGETAARVHKVLTDLLNAQDPETRGQSRLRFVPAWWDFLEALVRNLSGSLPEAKLMALRYGVLLPSLITPEQRTNLASIITENRTGEMLHYVDEWLIKVGNGEVAPLATDEEFKPVRKGSGDNSLLMQKLERLQGQVQAQTNLIGVKIREMNDLEDALIKAAALVRHHERHPVFTSLYDNFSSSQKGGIAAVNDSVKRLVALDKEVDNFFRDLEKMHNELKATQQKIDESGGVAVDTKAVIRELGSLRQMCKLSVGRQGNHFPVVMKNYLPQRMEELGTRENVLTVMAGVERLDPGLFLRSFKGSTNRIVPHVILMPSFGETGICWEPFEKFNRSTSRGRIGIPMYSKSLKMAVLTALGDLRWQVVKEKAGYRWMEEGLTGWYYQWFTDRGLRGDVKESFIQDYILWITKESEGTQKLDKDVRGIFWRNTPFPQEVREALRNRGFVYNELYKKDINRAMSDGY